MRLVLDTNTLVSGIGWDGPPRQILVALREARHSLMISTALLAELTRVLRYPKLRSIAAHPLLPVVLAWLYQPEHLVVSEERITIVRRDPADNLVLEAAVAGNADAIVSGDSDLLRLRVFRGIQILRAREFAAKYL